MNEKKQGLPAPSAELLEKAEQLIWNLLDDRLPAEDVPQLQTMIKEHDHVRQLYLDCVQIHTELVGHFAKEPKLELPDLPSPPILGSLGDSLPGVDPGPAVTD